MNIVTKSFTKSLNSQFSNSNSRKKPLKEQAHRKHRRRVRQNLEEVKKLANSGATQEELEELDFQLKTPKPSEIATYRDSPYF